MVLQAVYVLSNSSSNLLVADEIEEQRGYAIYSWSES